jgi:hypothetical protein
VTAIALGWRVHSSWAIVVAVEGPVASPAVVGRERVTMLDDQSLQEPYHAAVGRPLDEAMTLIRSVEERATSTAESIVGGFVSSLGPVAAVGVVGGNRQTSTDLARILSKHALLHASERDLYEQAVMEGATRAGLPVTTVPATGQLFDHASRLLGMDVSASVAALGKSIGPPWSKDHREAAAAALVALHAAT